MVSQRNINPEGNYKRIKSYASLSKKEMKRSKDETISEAVDRTVRNVPGGEFMMNVKIYSVNGKYFAVEGDVWGTNSHERLGFRVDDEVQWKAGFAIKIGTVVGLVDADYCMVQEEGTAVAKKVKYQDLLKVR